MLWTEQGTCTYELTAVVIACTAYLKLKPAKNLGMEGGGGQKIGEELLAVGSFW